MGGYAFEILEHPNLVGSVLGQGISCINYQPDKIKARLAMGGRRGAGGGLELYDLTLVAVPVSYRTLDHFRPVQLHHRH